MACRARRVWTSVRRVAIRPIDRLVIFGYICDRFGRKKAIVAGSLFFGALTLASVWVTSLNQLMLLRFIAGIGMGGVIPNSVALVAEYAPKRLRATWVT